MTLPSPTLSDAPNGPAQIQALASATDAELAVRQPEDTGWANSTLQHSWVNYGGVYGVARYRRINGVVHSVGLIKNGTSATGTVLFNLPAGFRPDHNTTVLVVNAVSGTTGGARLEIDTGGDVALLAYPPGGSNAFLGVEFSFAV